MYQLLELCGLYSPKKELPGCGDSEHKTSSGDVRPHSIDNMSPLLGSEEVCDVGLTHSLVEEAQEGGVEHLHTGQQQQHALVLHS